MSEGPSFETRIKSAHTFLNDGPGFRHIELDPGIPLDFRDHLAGKHVRMTVLSEKGSE